MIKKLRFQFICAIMAIVTVMLAVILGMVLHFTSENLQMQSISTMQTVASKPHHQGELRRTRGDVRLPYFSVEIGKTGDLIGMDGGYFDLSNREDIHKIVAAAMESPEETGILRRYGLRFLKHQAPKGYTIVFADVTAEVTAIRYLHYNCAVIFLVSMCAFLGMSILLSRWVVRPVEKAWEQQRQFVADASHELKTPLSVIMANAELMRSQDTAPEERDACAGNVLATTYQMRDLVENMLDMARVDNGSQKIQLAQVDLSQLVTDAVLSFRLLYEKKELGLESTIQQGIFLQGSERHLFQVMDVLLDNALKYSAPRGTVQVTLSRTGKNCRISVFSPGEPIPEGELKNIFKRFYRGDKTRAMNGSYGLGLSIAMGIVEIHKGTIWAESAEAGNTFYVQLPAAYTK